MNLALKLTCSTVLCALALFMAAHSALAGSCFGDIEEFATFPAEPGFPEGIAVDEERNTVYVAGAAAPGTAGNAMPSAVVAFDLDNGSITETFQTGDENLEAEHANTCIALDKAGRVYVLNSQRGLYRLNPDNGSQQDYASAIPDIPGLLSLKKGPRAPALRNRKPLIINDIAFGEDGTAYITDSLQATIWKVQPGGGAPEVWFQSFLFNSALFGFVGINGLRIDPAGERIFVTVTSSPGGRGAIFTVPLTASPQQKDLELFHGFARGDTPDGLAFGASGKLYVVINGDDSPGVIVLNPDGTGHDRITGQLFSSPANAAFDGRGGLLVVNHPISEGRKDPSLFKILRVCVDDTAAPLNRPDLP
jgi:sugar lactone lactonase YvrE